LASIIQRPAVHKKRSLRVHTTKSGKDGKRQEEKDTICSTFDYGRSGRPESGPQSYRKQRSKWGKDGAKKWNLVLWGSRQKMDQGSRNGEIIRT